MGDSTKTGTLSKLGKLFGKSSSNLPTAKHQSVSQVQEDRQAQRQSQQSQPPPPQQQQQPQQVQDQRELGEHPHRQSRSSSSATSSNKHTTINANVNVNANTNTNTASNSVANTNTNTASNSVANTNTASNSVANTNTSASTAIPTAAPKLLQPNAVQENPISSEEDFILSQVENDKVSPLRQIKQPQPQLHTQSQLQQNSHCAPILSKSNNLSPAGSHSPINGNLSTTTSPISVISLEQKLKGQNSTSKLPSSGMAKTPANEKTPQMSGAASSLVSAGVPPSHSTPTTTPTSGRPSPSVSRSSSRKATTQQAKSGLFSSKSKNGSNTSLVSGGMLSQQQQQAQQQSMSSSSLSLQPPPNLPRFVMLENGNHEHHLRSAKRHEKLSNMLKDLLGAKKLRDEAKSAVPDLLQGAMQQSTSQLQQMQQSTSQLQPNMSGRPPTLFAGLVTQVKNHTSPYHQPGTADVVVPNKDPNASAGPDSRSFVEKYGRCQEVIGRGSFGVVRISHKKIDALPPPIAETTAAAASSSSTAAAASTTTSSSSATATTSPITNIPSSSSSSNTLVNSNPTEKLYAVKEFKRRPSENEKKYNRRLTSEFCISSSLKHINIIDTLDLLKDAKGDYCEVMEFCSGGDLYTLIIASGKLEYAEADCFFKQLIRGVNYMHNMGVAHRDLKPENLLLTQNGVLKITDFGNSECFRMAWETEVQFSEGICGSSPYIAPEEFSQESFDPRCVDIWSCGVIYMAMRTGRQLWKQADASKDEFYEEYLIKRKDATGYEPIENLKRARCRNVIYSILDPKPERRITGKQILNSEWGREIKVCEAGEAHPTS